MKPLKVLLDECIDRRLSKHLIGFEIVTVSYMKWSGLKNGELLTEAQKDFDLFLTVDQNLPHQQQLDKYDIAVVVIESKSNRINDLLALKDQIISAMQQAETGKVNKVGL